MTMKNKSVKALLLTLLFFLITAPAQALIPVINPTGYELAEALGGKDSDYRIIEVNGCIVQYKKIIDVEKNIYGPIKTIDLKEALKRVPFCEKVSLLIELSETSEPNNNDVTK